MPRTKEQNEQIRRQRKQDILDGALKVYAEKGYAAAEIGDVAKAGGVARGLVYYYFKDKRALFKELFYHVLEKTRKSIQSHFESTQSPIILLEKFLLSMYERNLEEQETMLFFFRMRHDLKEILTDEERSKLIWHMENMQVIIQTIQRGIEKQEIKDISPELLASQFWGCMLHGMIFLQKHKRKLQEEQKTPGEIKEILSTLLIDAASNCLAVVRKDHR